MTKTITTITSPHKDFEGIKRRTNEGTEYWSARELMPLLGYDQWKNFEKVITKAMKAAKNSNQVIHNHFVDVGKMVELGSGSTRKVKDYQLSRYACYLIAQNSDPRKEQIAIAQTYFAIQTRKQEIFQLEQQRKDQKRLMIRKEVKKQNVKLFGTAKRAGVDNFGLFNEYGYYGLYGLPSREIKKKKGIGKDSILDRAGSTELAANLFRITQTDDKINRDPMHGQQKANDTHMEVGNEVRNAIKKIGGSMPEDLLAERHIKEIKKKERTALKEKN